MLFAESIRKNIQGLICQRQSTFLVFRDMSSDKIIRIDYDDKKEFHIASGEFFGISVLDEHPLLEQYEYTDTLIYISSLVQEPEKIEKDLAIGISQVYGDWRKFDDYANNECSMGELLKGGYGLLYKGPPSGAESVMEILRRYNINYSVPQTSSLSGHKYKVLFLGNNYIIAKEFVFKEEVNHNI